jgi:hypothetical protein
LWWSWPQTKLKNDYLAAVRRRFVSTFGPPGSFGIGHVIDHLNGRTSRNENRTTKRTWSVPHQSPVQERIVNEGFQNGHQTVLVASEHGHDGLARTAISAFNSGHLPHRKPINLRNKSQNGK